MHTPQGLDFRDEVGGEGFDQRNFVVVVGFEKALDQGALERTCTNFVGKQPVVVLLSVPLHVLVWQSVLRTFVTGVVVEYIQLQLVLTLIHFDCIEVEVIQVLIEDSVMDINEDVVGRLIAFEVFAEICYGHTESIGG